MENVVEIMVIIVIICGGSFDDFFGTSLMIFSAIS